MKFDITFEQSLVANTVGSLRILELAKFIQEKNPNFCGIEQISTAYANVNRTTGSSFSRTVLKEEFYYFSVTKDGQVYEIEKLIEMILDEVKLVFFSH